MTCLFLKYILYYFTANRYPGHPAVHNDVADLLKCVSSETDPIDYSRIETIYRDLLRDKGVLKVEDPGAGSSAGEDDLRSVRQIVKRTSLGRKYGRLLSRLVHRISPATIIEFGTGAGFSTMYMGLGCPHSRIWSMEGCATIADLAERNIKRLGLENTEIKVGTFDEILPGLLMNIHHALMVFIDGDHRGERLKRYFEMLLPCTDSSTIVVLDDIRWSDSMEKAWKEIIQRKEVSVSIDLFRMGILLLNRDTSKQHLVIRF